MARLDAIHPANVPANDDGDWFVDTRCIDCGACRDLAPAVFDATTDQSYVHAQPTTPELDVAAQRAALVCPTQSIGTRSVRRLDRSLVPIPIADGVLQLPDNSEDSFGANSYLVARERGNLLVDSPRFTRRNVATIEAAGGLAHVLLSHRDDVADADRYAEHFGARTWIHADDSRAAPYATDRFDGLEPTPIDDGLLAIPVPGHTRGSACYLLDATFLFTGDSLAWSHRRGDLVAFRDACWYSWAEQTRSLERLAAHRFEWVIPGHGARHHAPADEMHRRLVALTRRMSRAA